MEAENLEQLGLNKYEALAYKALVHLGKASASEVSRDSGVPYGRIYDVLNDLVAKKLAKIIPEKSKKFAPGDPEQLAELLIKKKKDLESLDQGLKKLKQTYEEQAEPAVTIAQGERNFWKLADKIREPKKYNYNYMYTGQVTKWSKKWKHQEKKSKTNKRALVRYDKETEKNMQWHKKNAKGRKYRSLSFKNNGVVGIVQDDEVTMFTLIKANTHILIKDKPFANFMKNLFEIAWDKGEDI